MTRAAQVGALVVGAALCALVIAGSRVPWTPVPDGSALIRLSWRTVLPAVEECREPTENELAGVPAHMRPDSICTGRAIPFRLRFTLDGDVVVDEVVTGAGSRGERPVHVYHEVSVTPGAHRLDVEFGPEEPAAAGVPDGLGAALRESVQLDPLDIALVTRVDGSLVLR